MTSPTSRAIGPGICGAARTYQEMGNRDEDRPAYNRGGFLMRGPIRSGRRTLVFIAFLAIASNAPASQVFSDYTVTSWTKRDGLPAGSIWSICQDNDGCLWLGTSSGLFG